MNSSRKIKISNLKLKLPPKSQITPLYKGIGLVLILVLIVGSFAFYQHKKDLEHEVYTRAFNVMIEDKNVGVVRDKEMVRTTIKEIQNELASNYGMEIAIENQTRYEEIHAEDQDLTSVTELKRNIKANLGYKVIAYAIVVDDKEIGTLASGDLAYKILENIKQPFIENLEEGTEIQEIKFVEDVKVVKKETDLSRIDDFDTIQAILQKGTDEEKTHIVEKGESFWTIADKYNLTVEELIKANLDKDNELIHPGDELSLIVPKPFISIATIEKVSYEDKVAFETEYEYSSNMYNDESRIKIKGTLGKSRVVAQVEKHNGIEVNRDIIQETLLEKPGTQIVLKGTVEPPPKKGTGIFMNPLSVGRLTSRFGYRWGRMHQGIDLAARTGTPIKAADGGVVIYSGWKSGLGYVVEIDHGGGFKTRYGHCSKLYVKKGDKVYKGKTIAAVGNTGNSTGPHLHFEVLKYDSAQNPYNYIGKQYR